ncbi:MAG TPA: portal protein, partial [Candidatus Paceibacterota bacterium]|nr:portal protein [Candidatus Paceibacterota bacterium]
MARKAEKLAREARIACEKWREYFKYNIDEYHKLHNFVLGRQWTDDEEDMLKTFKKVPLQFNKLATLINSLLGEQQQNTPQLEVVPLSNCDEETASLRQMIVKDIMLGEDAKTVYQVAAAQAFVGGFGAFLWDTDYSSPRSFDLDMIPRYFKDASRCYWDLGAEEVNKTDGLVCGYINRMTRAKFRQTFGSDIEEKILTESGITASREEIALAVQPSMTDDPFSWADDEGITINNFYKRKFKKDMLYKLSNGKTLNQEEMDELVEKSREVTMMLQQQQEIMGEFSGLEGQQESSMPMEQPTMAPEMSEVNEEFITLYDGGEPVRIEDRRKSKRSKIMHYKIAGEYILEESEVPSDDLPLIFVDQNSYYDKKGKQVCRSFIVDAVDAQRYINYLGTQSAFILKISRYDQYMASKKNVQSLDTQRTWRDPYTVQGALLYDESPSGAKPEQLRPPELSVSLTNQYQRAIEDLYTSTGLYPSRMGQQGNETSGVAIDARTRQGSYST